MRRIIKLINHKIKYFVTIVIVVQIVALDAQCEYKQVLLNNDYNCPSNDYVLVFEDDFNGNSLDLTK